MNDEPIEVSSSDDEIPYTDSRSSLGKGHPSRASQREAMNAGRAAASSSKAKGKHPPKATTNKASSSSKGKRKRNDSDDDSEFEGKKLKSNAPRRKFPPFEKWEDDVFVEAILANYTPDHQVSECVLLRCCCRADLFFARPSSTRSTLDARSEACHRETTPSR